MARRYFPAFLDLTGQPCVVIGGGSIATDKIDGLLQAGAAVTVVAPTVGPRVAHWVSTGAVRLVERDYQPGDLAGAWLVIAATADAAVNQAVYNEGRQRRLLVNVVDAPAQCNYITPSVVRRGHLLVAISTQGVAPAFSAALRRYLERQLNERLTDFLARAEGWRDRLKREEASPVARRQYWHRLMGRAAPLLLGFGATATALPELPSAVARSQPCISMSPPRQIVLGVVGLNRLTGRAADLTACQARLAQKACVTKQLAAFRQRSGSPLLDGWVVAAEGDVAEVYYQTSQPRFARRVLGGWFKTLLAPATLSWPPEAYSGVQGVEHLFRVACGLHSTAPGSTAVHGVLRRALLTAGLNATGTVSLEQAFRAALAVARRVHRGGPHQCHATELARLNTRLAELAARCYERVFTLPLPTSAG